MALRRRPSCASEPVPSDGDLDGGETVPCRRARPRRDTPTGDVAGRRAAAAHATTKPTREIDLNARNALAAAERRTPTTRSTSSSTAPALARGRAAARREARAADHPPYTPGVGPNTVSIPLVNEPTDIGAIPQLPVDATAGPGAARRQPSSRRGGSAPWCCRIASPSSPRGRCGVRGGSRTRSSSSSPRQGPARRCRPPRRATRPQSPPPSMLRLRRCQRRRDRPARCRGGRHRGRCRCCRVADAEAAAPPADAAVRRRSRRPAAPRSRPSTPAGARVFLDGADSGVTPLKLPGSPDKHSMARSCRRHELYVAQVDGRGAFNIAMKEVTPCRRSRGDQGAACKDKDRYYVSVDGKPTGHDCPTERIEAVSAQHTVDVYDSTTEKHERVQCRCHRHAPVATA